MMASKPLTGRAVLLMVLAFFAATIGINVLMATVALESFDGLDQPDAFRKGRAFNDVLAAQRAETALGWSAQITPRIINPASRTIALTLRMTDKQGRGILNLAITGALKRPTDAGLDTPVRFTTLGTGLYRAQVPLPAWGRWTLVAQAQAGEDRARISQTLLITP